MTLNSLMHCERKNYLENCELNKGNGYRKAFAIRMGKQIELRIPRGRLGMFQPMVLPLIRDQKQQLEDLSFKFYGNGLTTSQTGSLMGKIYGKYYSKSAISNITATFYEQMQQWREQLNKEFRRTFKIRNSMPNFESALTLLSKVAMDKEDGYMKYPIYNFKFDEKMNELV